MKSGFRTLACAAAGAALLVSLGALSARAADQVLVGLITKTDTNPFFVKMREGASAKAKELGIKLQTFAGKFDGDNDTQVAAVENLISAGAKGILITPSDTKTNANRVPIFERSAASLIAKIPAGSPTANPAIQVEICGVLNLGCTFEKNPGNNRSRDIAYQMRACPY